MRLFTAFLLILIIMGASLSSYYVYVITTDPDDRSPLAENVYVGVTFGANTTQEGKLLVDKVKSYTNLFVIDSWPIATNETALTELSDYVVKSGLYLMVYFAVVSHVIHPWHVSWLEMAKERWGEKFAGVYLLDEPGGKQLDLKSWNGEIPLNATSYSEAATQFAAGISSTYSMQDLKRLGIPAFTADYGLYWFDYLAGYDAVFAEFGWNHSRPLHLGLVRGAANVQKKQWGIIITWEYLHPPYIESGPELFRDMVTAYNAGAQYVIVFNYPQINQYGILTEEHFSAIQKFWAYIHSPLRIIRNLPRCRVAFVLPKDYGWGMRTPEDTIWGMWRPDALSPKIWQKTQALLGTYGLSLDIIYDDPDFDIRDGYAKLYFWNDVG